MFRVTSPFKIVCIVALAASLAACSSSEKEAPAVSTTQPSASSIKPGSADDFRVNVGDTVFFDVDQHSIRADAQSVLAKQAAWLQKYPSVRLLVEGHCDERGTREYNLALGERRAGSVKEVLVGDGVEASRLETVSFGEEKPADAGHDDGAWSKNRRGELIYR